MVKSSSFTQMYLKFHKARAGHWAMTYEQSWALSVFMNFFNNRKWFCIFYQVNSLLLHQSYLKRPPPVINLTKNGQKNFLLLKKWKQKPEVPSSAYECSLQLVVSSCKLKSWNCKPQPPLLKLNLGTANRK